MATSMNRDQIVSHAVQIGGNPTISALATDWLNNLIDTLSTGYRWPELEKTATGVLSAFNTALAVVPPVDLPADFGDLWDVHALKLVDSNGGFSPLTPETPEWYDLLTDPTTTGRPTNVVFNLNEMHWTPYPAPEQQYTYYIRYVLKPSRLTAGTQTIPFGSDDIFIQALYCRILQFESDTRYEKELAVLERLIRQYIGQFNASPIKSRKVRLNANVFRTIGNFR